MTLQVPVCGSYKLALGWLLAPPATSTLPLESSVVEKPPPNVWVGLPVVVQAPVAGSYSSAAIVKADPKKPTASTFPVCKRTPPVPTPVGGCCKLPVGLQVPATGS